MGFFFGIMYIFVFVVVTEEELNKTCGVGIVVTDAEIVKLVSKAIETEKAQLLEDRYYFPMGKKKKKYRRGQKLTS